LLRERHQPYLREAERKRRLQHRIDRGNQRLDGVVEEMGQADAGQDRDRGSLAWRDMTAYHEGSKGTKRTKNKLYKEFFVIFVPFVAS
jgi:hypothetical protein